MLSTINYTFDLVDISGKKVTEQFQLNNAK